MSYFVLCIIVIYSQVYSSTSKLRIGFYVDDGFFTSDVACRRAVYEAKAALESLGHEVIVVPVCSSAYDEKRSPC